jgi:hypothetical protein
LIVRLDKGSDKERLVPLMWDEESSEFIKDIDFNIKYIGPSCIINEAKDYDLAIKSVIPLMQKQTLCVCNL